MADSRPRIAIVAPAFEAGGGVPAVAAFLYRVLASSGRFVPHVVSLATSARDEVSTRLCAPRSWRRAPGVRQGAWSGIDCLHVGSSLAELETRRYHPREPLTRLLGESDLIQVVAGFPAWACSVVDARRPVVLQVATLVEVERSAMLQHGALPLRLWRRAMTARVASYQHQALCAADAVMVENRWMYDRLSASLPGGRVHFAPPGVDVDFFTPAGSGSGYILSVGRFWDPRKNIRVLMDAYARLRSRMGSPPDLVLAGAAPSSRDLDHAERIGIAPHLHVHEGVSAQRLRELYRGAAVFALSSDEEGFGLVIAEAMAAGLPVVATDCGGPSTCVIAGETGLLVPVGDADAMADALIRVLRDPGLAEEMGRRGRRRVAAEFSLQAAGQRFVAVYDRLLGLPGEALSA